LGRVAYLVTRHDGTADSLGSNLRHIQDDDGGDKANANTCNQTARNKYGDSSRGHLKDDADREDAASTNDGRAATNPVGEGASEKRTEEGTSRED
jgi:hypothetical protein